MMTLNALDLPEELAEALYRGGITSVEALCAKTIHEISSLDGIGPRFESVRTVRSALAKIGIDLRRHYEDPVGSTVSPSHKALQNLFESLNLMPDTRAALTTYLLKAITRWKLLSQIDAEGHNRDQILL